MSGIGEQVYATEQAIADGDAIAETACRAIGMLPHWIRIVIPAGAHQEQQCQNHWANGLYLLELNGGSHGRKIGRDLSGIPK
jgi:hypothetical protein